MCCGKEKEVLILCCGRWCRTVVWSVVGRDVVVQGIRVMGWVIAGTPEWYVVVVSFPCLDECVRTRCGCG